MCVCGGGGLLLMCACADDSHQPTGCPVVCADLCCADLWCVAVSCLAALAACRCCIPRCIFRHLATADLLGRAACGCRRTCAGFLSSVRSLTGLDSVDVPSALRHFSRFSDSSGSLSRAAFFQAFDNLVRPAASPPARCMCTRCRVPWASFGTCRVLALWLCTPASLPPRSYAPRLDATRLSRLRSSPPRRGPLACMHRV